MLNRCPLLLLFAVAFTAVASASPPPSLEQVMSDPDWIGNAPEQAYWSDDGETVYYSQKRQGEDLRDHYSLSLASGNVHQLDRSELPSDSGHNKTYSPDRRWVAWTHHGDVMAKQLASGKVLPVTRTPEEESQPVFSADSDTLYFQRAGQFFGFSLSTSLLRQVSNVDTGKDPHAEPDFNTLRQQQLRTYSTVVEDKRRADAVRDAETAARSTLPQPIYLDDKYEVVSRALSPDGQRLALVVLENSYDEGRKGIMPNYVTADGYTSTRDLRTRVGEQPAAPLRLLMLDLAEGDIAVVDTSELPDINDDPLSQLRRSALRWHVDAGADRDVVEKLLERPERRELVSISLAWSPNGKHLAAMVIAADFKDRWLATVNADNVLEVQHQLTDEAWINWQFNQFGWVKDNKTLWFLSEESGYSHLYSKAMDERRARQLTAGDFVVRSPALSPDHAYAYVQSNRAHPGNWQIYRVPLSGGNLSRVTAMDGVSSFKLSPDGSQLLVSRSTMARHPDLYVGPATGEGELRQITDTVSDQFKSIDWVTPEIVEVPSSHVDRPIYSKLYLPKDFDASGKYPAVMFVHGAGYTQNAHMGWPYYFREFMFHTVLANAGFVVLDMDYRASEGYGRDWRTAIYRNMGHPELEDYLDGIDYLVENAAVDPQRVGIYGGSYGGFMTFMALFRAPDAFAAGAALRPVVDWMHYSHWYTGRILNTPLIDPEAYQRSSPINHAQGLQQPLLIAAGMQDDNVFFQDSVLMVQRLIELKKEDFEIAIYPLDAHGFVHPESWLDEYRRIFKLMQREVMNRRQ